MNAPNTSASDRPRLAKCSFRWVVFGPAGLVTLIVLAYAVIFFVGRHEWVSAQAELRAKGEKLTLAELIPPPVPDADNFFAAPMWNELADLVETPGPDGLKKTPRLPEGQRRLDVFKSIVGNGRDSSYGAIGNPEQGKLRNLENAEALLKALEVARPALNEIEILAARPAARFPILYEDGYNVSLVHIIYLQQIAKVISLRAAAEAAAGQGIAAEADVILMLRLAETVKTEPFLISHLMRFAILKIATSSVWEGIERGCWNDAQLAEIEQKLANVELARGLAVGLRGERAAINDWSESVMRSKGFLEFMSWEFRQKFERLRFIVSGTMKPGLFEEYATQALSATYPRGWIYSDLAFYNRSTQRAIECADASPLRDFSMALQNELPPANYAHLWLRFFPPGIDGAAGAFAETEARLREARIACALERFRLRNGEYPETLGGLVPDFIAALPDDPMTNRAFHYRRIAPGDFLLWSVGWNGTDDGGVPPDARNGTVGDWIWRKAIR